MSTRITIAGDIGSGKTTVAKLIAKQLAVDALSTGSIQRQLASTRGISTLELNVLAERDPSIDRDIDQYLKNLPNGDLVVESRMAWHFVPSTRRAFLYITRQEAAERIISARRDDETYAALSDAMTLIANRRKSEVKRFKKYYGVNIDDLRNYDVVIDTTFASAERTAHHLLHQSFEPSGPSVWLDPRNLVPTQGVRDYKSQVVEEIMRTIKISGFDSRQPIAAVYVDHIFFIIDGHNRTAAAIKSTTQYIPVRVVACDDDFYLKGLTARRYVKDAVFDAMIYDWEDAVGFRYKHEIWKLPQ